MNIALIDGKIKTAVDAAREVERAFAADLGVVIHNHGCGDVVLARHVQIGEGIAVTEGQCLFGAGFKGDCRTGEGDIADGLPGRTDIDDGF